MSVHIPESVLPLFAAAGWHTDRRVTLPDSLDRGALQDHPALEILETLAGLHVGRCDSGIECATSDIEFGSLGDRYEDVTWWEEALDTHLVEIAQVDHGHGLLYIGADGRGFVLSYIHDLFSFVGETFGETVDRLLRGLRVRPMIRSDQVRVTAYGIEYTRDSPEVYDYRQKPSN